jgi:hypothetical protein
VAPRVEDNDILPGGQLGDQLGQEFAVLFVARQSRVECEADGDERPRQIGYRAARGRR